MLYMAQVVRLKCFSVFTPIDIGKSFSHMTPPTHVFDMKSMCRNTHDAIASSLSNVSCWQGISYTHGFFILLISPCGHKFFVCDSLFNNESQNALDGLHVAPANDVLERHHRSLNPSRVSGVKLHMHNAIPSASTTQTLLLGGFLLRLLSEKVTW